MNDQLSLGIAWLLVFIVSVVCHEASHALVASLLGDDTARRAGLVTLDPSPHIRREPLGMVVVPVISFLMAGWMLGWGSAPINPDWALRHPRASALMALAGPAANLVLVLVAIGLIHLGLALGWWTPPSSLTFDRLVAVSADHRMLDLLASLVSILLSLNVLLCVFNLLPLPPLDGSRLPLLVLPYASARSYMTMISDGRWALIGIIIAWNIAGRVIGPAWLLMVNHLFPGYTYG